MPSFSSVKNLAFGSWKIILAFILGVVAHCLYREWALKNSFSLGDKLGLGQKKVTAVKTAPVKSSKFTEFDEFSAVDGLATEVDDIPLPPSGIEPLDG